MERRFGPVLRITAYLFLISQFAVLVPYNNSLHLYGRGIICVIFFVLLISKNIKFEKKELNVFILLTLPFCFYMFLQGLITQDVMPLKKAISFFSGSVSAIAVYKMLGLKKIFNFLLVFILFNCLTSFIWLLNGTLYIDSLSGKLYTVYLTLQQAIYPLNQSLNGFDIVRLSGFTGNPNTIGALTAFCFVYGNFIEVPPKKKIFMYIVALVAIIISQSRGAVLFIIIYCFFVMIQSRYYPLWKKLIISSLFIVAIFGIMQWSEYRDNITDISSGRIDMASMAYSAFENSSEIYQVAGIPYNINDFLWNETHQMKITIDNSYLVSLISFGYLGTLINYFSLICLLMYIYFKTHNNKVVAFYIALFIYGGVESILLNSDQKLLYEILFYDMLSRRLQIE